MKYDDGYVAYLNGVPIGSRGEPAALAWDSDSTSTHPDGDAEVFEDEDITSFANALVAGDNMLAIHGLNASSGSSDFLILPELVADDTPPPPPLVWPNYQATLFASGFNRPTDIQHAGDGTKRLFVVERAGTVRIVNPNGSVMPGTFLNISNRVGTSTSQGDERGFLGIAFPPDFASKGEFYASYTGTSGSSFISRFNLDPNDPSGNTADAASEENLLTLIQPFGNHNGGQIRFGTDGYLYIGFGDGGSGGDPGDRAQNPTVLLGKMLRIHVDGVKNGYEIPGDNPFVGVAGVRDEIWALGLRNPWRWSFDRETGDMWIADVGQNAYEEVSKVDAGSNSGLNFGWNQFEGFSSYPGGGPLSPTGTEIKPIFDISQGPDFSITGGFVYRGSLWPRMKGIYFFADYGSGRELGAQTNADDEWVVFPFQDQNRSISAWGEDEDGELYYVNIANGQMYKVSDTRGADYMNVTDSGISGSGQQEFTFVTEDGTDYQLQMSTDLQIWIDIGLQVTASGTSHTFTDPDLVGAETRKFLRALEVE